MPAKLLPFPVRPPSEAEFLAAVELETAGDLAGAEAAYIEILARSEDMRAAINLGSIYHQRKRYEEAEELYRRATVADPNYCLAFFNLGTTLDDLGRRGEAIEALREALRINPRYGDAHYNLATFLSHAGETAKALKHWRDYLEVDPSSVYASHARDMIRRAVDTSRLSVVQVRARTCDSLSLSKKPLPDAHDGGLVHALTLLHSPERAAVDPDPLGGFPNA